MRLVKKHYSFSSPFSSSSKEVKEETCWPLSNLITKAKAKSIAKGLLIITPIMFVTESFLSALMGIFNPYEFLILWASAFPIIFLCYFITGKKVWNMDWKQATLIGILMAIITNPAYIASFF